MGSNLVSRIISALIGALLLMACGYWGGPLGLALISGIAIAVAAQEYAALAFGRLSANRILSVWFLSLSLVLFVLMVLFPEHSLLSLALGNSIFLSVGLWLTRNKLANQELLSSLGVGSLGLLYCVSLPVFGVKTLFLANGVTWFALLLVLVFSGDIGAYFGGRFLGKRKLMPELSPNKTVEGALVGLLSSCVSTLTFMLVLFPTFPVGFSLFFALLCGSMAQAGDLLMSLIKRVAQVKDSGFIMPGHGGMLDRLDGIFISCPLVYGFALVVDRWTSSF